MHLVSWCETYPLSINYAARSSVCFHIVVRSSWHRDGSQRSWLQGRTKWPTLDWTFIQSSVCMSVQATGGSEPAPPRSVWSECSADLRMSGARPPDARPLSTPPARASTRQYLPIAPAALPTNWIFLSSCAAGSTYPHTHLDRYLLQFPLACSFLSGQVLFCGRAVVYF